MRQGPVLLTGAAGLLGGRLLACAPNSEVVALTHRRAVTGIASIRADLRQPTEAAPAVASVEPALVIHAAYMTDRVSIVDATRNVVDAARAVAASVLFISSDAVFLGDGLPRDEEATPDAGWDYGRWKAEAERIVLEGSDDAIVIRAPLLVSVDPDDHVVRQLRAAAANGETTRWFTDEMRRPALASEVAGAVWRIAELPIGERSGCWHLAGAERLSRYEIARRMVDLLHLPASTVEPSTRPEGTDRSRDIAFTDAHARAVVGWSPSPIS